MSDVVLPGGFVNQVVRVGATVRRQPAERAPFVHNLLKFLGEQGWPGAPKFLGMDQDGREILEYVEGSAAWEGEQQRLARSDECLISVSRLVREFHDLTAGSPLAQDHEVVCHNDLSPKNTVYTVEGDSWRPRAFIDWDLAAPGERIHDIAHVCWQYLGLGPELTNVPETARQIRLICDTYGHMNPQAVVDTVVWWQDRCWQGIEAGADRGESAMMRLREQGVTTAIRAARDWVADRRSALAVGMS